MPTGRAWADYSPDEDLPPLVFGNTEFHLSECSCSDCKKIIKHRKNNIYEVLSMLDD